MKINLIAVPTGPPSWVPPRKRRLGKPFYNKRKRAARQRAYLEAKAAA